ncbi:MAG: T9SS type A sorting domain-containing protein [Bacteroidia bacterium]
MRNISIFIICIIYSNSFAQGPKITPLKSNSEVANFKGRQSAKRSINDTIQLPFIDDFTSTTVYPNMKYWVDSQVYINNHFPVSPPSYGVATFDNLDKKGKPYQFINGNQHNHSDSLTSNYINLKNYLNGVNLVNYTIADSIYLSFFFQCQGIGDPLDATDSLVLKFKDAGGFWKTVWKTTGTSVQDFKQVLIGVLNTDYLIPDFQFRFINYGKTTGNMNQWHIDYVRLNQGRNMFDTVIQDLAINAIPSSPLQWYHSMPYDHYKAQASYNSAPFHTVQLRNNFNTAVNVQYKCEVRNQFNSVIMNYPLSSSARNVSSQSDSSEDFSAFKFDTLTGETPSLHFKYTIAPLANDFLPDNYNSIGNNNEYTNSVYFKNYFAYDDGTAEGGYGLDYGSLPSGPGYAAIKYTTFKPDTLRGLSIFFNRSVADVEFKSFTLMVWKNISEPPAANTDNDVVLKEYQMNTTVYTDSINGFTTIVFDTAVVLSQGNFYIGWKQNINFILNVGYDNNYKFAKVGGRNPNLFFNLNGYWEKVSANITGAVMMRPIVGRKIPNPNSTSIPTVKYVNKTSIYPNPSGNSPLLNVNSENRIVSIKVRDINGRMLLESSGEDLKSLEVGELQSGIYIIELSDYMHNASVHKWIKQ